MPSTHKVDQRGALHVLLVLIAVVVIGAIGFIGYKVMSKPKAIPGVDTADCQRYKRSGIY
jgi:hypothetical protein